MVGRSSHRGSSGARLWPSTAASYSFHPSLYMRFGCLSYLFVFLVIANTNAQIKVASPKSLERLKTVYNDAAPLERRIQNATCEAGFDWANNAAGVSPCVMAAATSACNTAGHNVPPLTPGAHYDPPNLVNNTVNVCQCSWAAYNLISMCTLCQGEIFSLFTWVSYSSQCENLTQTDSYFPSSFKALLPSNDSIPFYAQTDPTQWSDGVFNITQAKGLADGTLSLQSSTATHNSNTTPVAAIVGGSVGAAAVLLCFLSVIIWMRRRRPRAATSYQDITTPPHIHHRMSAAVTNAADQGLSDASQVRESGYFSSMFTSESGSSSRNSQILRPYTKSYNHSLSDDSTVYARQNDVLPVARPPSTNSLAQGTQVPGHLWQIGHYTNTTYTAVPTTDSNIPRNTASGRRPSSPPPYEVVTGDRLTE
ncbi:hypothetical protein C8R42DRAFT_124362 [Lentinula raphanica]|nr:hypothetical protein C8R42DRAFT_124362 [Lentinula raphanica]